MPTSAGSTCDAAERTSAPAGRDPAEAIDAPTLAAISTGPAGGGVARVASLLWKVLQARWGDRARLLRLMEDDHSQPSFDRKVRYALKLALLQARGATDWLLFSHLGLAKPLVGMPRSWRRPYAVFLHGIEVWRPLTAAERTVLAGADLRLANSHYTASRVMDAHPEIGPVVPCPLALPGPLDDADGGAEASGPRAEGRRVVLSVGRMLASERYKGHDELIDVWPAVVDVVPDAQLVIVGEGDDLPRLRRKAARSGAGASILFTGFVSPSALAAWYRRAAIFCLPSRGEGFGLVYLEAMAHRLACIGSTVDAAGEVIVAGQTGLLVDPRRPEELAGAITELLVDEDRRRRMGQAGYDRLNAYFRFDSFARRLCAAIAASLKTRA